MEALVIMVDDWTYHPGNIYAHSAAENTNRYIIGFITTLTISTTES